jgi:hypothetical protein
MLKTEKPLIFISCGQWAKREKKLGQSICELIRKIRPDLEPYFAQDQSTLDGLSNNILKALRSAAGLICVMHKRGDVSHGKKRKATRGSVWIEQEIAITAFVTHALDRQIPVLFYKSRRVSLEGIRSVLQLNPRVEFTQEAEVLDDLRGALPGFQFKRFAELDLEPRLYSRGGAITSAGQNYEFYVDLENVGTQAVADYLVELYFPRRFLPGNHGLGLNQQKSSPTHICLELPHTKRLKGGCQFYPGKKINICRFEYFVNDQLRDSGALSDEVRVVVWSGNMKPKTVVRKMSELEQRR